VFQSAQGTDAGCVQLASSSRRASIGAWHVVARHEYSNMRPPQAMVWNEHDIFEGWGSYPDIMQTCPVFQGARACARWVGLFASRLLLPLPPNHDGSAQVLQHMSDKGLTY
jgi:hypothetical protein